MRGQLREKGQASVEYLVVGLASEMGDDGTIVQRVDVYCSPIPDWVGKQGYSPSSWIGAWQ